MSKAMKPHHYACWVVLFGLVVVAADSLDRLLTKPKVCEACLITVALKQAHRDELRQQRVAKEHAE